jgi:hypothetical protein
MVYSSENKPRLMTMKVSTLRGLVTRHRGRIWNASNSRSELVYMLTSSVVTGDENVDLYLVDLMSCIISLEEDIERLFNQCATKSKSDKHVKERTQHFKDTADRIIYGNSKVPGLLIILGDGVAQAIRSASELNKLRTLDRKLSDLTLEFTRYAVQHCGLVTNNKDTSNKKKKRDEKKQQNSCKDTPYPIVHWINVDDSKYTMKHAITVCSVAGWSPKIDDPIGGDFFVVKKQGVHLGVAKLKEDEDTAPPSPDWLQIALRTLKGVTSGLKFAAKLLFWMLDYARKHFLPKHVIAILLIALLVFATIDYWPALVAMPPYVAAARKLLQNVDWLSMKELLLLSTIESGDVSSTSTPALSASRVRQKGAILQSGDENRLGLVLGAVAVQSSSVIKLTGSQLIAKDTIDDMVTSVGGVSCVMDTLKQLINTKASTTALPVTGKLNKEDSHLIKGLSVLGFGTIAVKLAQLAQDLDAMMFFRRVFRRKFGI